MTRWRLERERDDFLVAFARPSNLRRSLYVLYDTQQIIKKMARQRHTQGRRIKAFVDKYLHFVYSFPFVASVVQLNRCVSWIMSHKRACAQTYFQWLLTWYTYAPIPRQDYIFLGYKCCDQITSGSFSYKRAAFYTSAGATFKQIWTNLPHLRNEDILFLMKAGVAFLRVSVSD